MSIPRLVYFVVSMFSLFLLFAREQKETKRSLTLQNYVHTVLGVNLIEPQQQTRRLNSFN